MSTKEDYHGSRPAPADSSSLSSQMVSLALSPAPSTLTPVSYPETSSAGAFPPSLTILQQPPPTHSTIKPSFLFPMPYSATNNDDSKTACDTGPFRKPRGRPPAPSPYVTIRPTDNVLRAFYAMVKYKPEDIQKDCKKILDKLLARAPDTSARLRLIPKLTAELGDVSTAKGTVAVYVQGATRVDACDQLLSLSGDLGLTNPNALTTLERGIAKWREGVVKFLRQDKCRHIVFACTENTAGGLFPILLERGTEFSEESWQLVEDARDWLHAACKGTVCRVYRSCGRDDVSGEVTVDDLAPVLYHNSLTSTRAIHGGLERGGSYELTGCSKTF